MAYTKTIVCLANSIRPGGSCVAGKEVSAEGGFGAWIRPVNAQNDDAILPEDQKFADGGHAQVLDVISIPLLEHTPNQHQQENHAINIGKTWEKKGVLNKSDLPQLLDHAPGELWVNESGSEKNDRIPTSAARNLRSSLLLIRPESPMTITVDWHARHRGRRDVIATFRHNHCAYQLKVTDPLAQKKYSDKSLHDYHESGTVLPCQYPVATDNVYLCLSITEMPVGRHYYKLVAAIIGDPD